MTSQLLVVASNYALNHNEGEKLRSNECRQRCAGAKRWEGRMRFDWLEAGLGLAAAYVQHMIINNQKNINFLCKICFPCRRRLGTGGGVWGRTSVGRKHLKGVGWVIRFPPKALAPVMLSSLDYLR